MKNSNYIKFALMMILSFVIMYAIMFTNVVELNHIMLSTTRTYMAILMICPMTIIMLLFMWKMYENKKLNVAIMGFATLLFFSTLFALRNQSFINDISYMKAMIPHHSSAILTSENTNFEDDQTQQLANDIIAAQKNEIDLMEEYINRIQNK
ncbi:MAG: DUF305 domain-containing protein [Chitinophagales bacterium]|nr:DUF305 domain-containing protein [Chitinophagales bacterium]